MSTIVPSKNKYFVRKEAPRSASSSILAPDASNSKEESHEGTIVSVPDDVLSKIGANLPAPYQPGFRVLFGKYAGTKVTVDGEDLYVMDESEILGRFAD